MSITTTTSTTSSSTTSSTLASTASAAALDFDDFLSILTTQMQNQDPLDPMDTTEYTNQLLTYAQVGQQEQTNEYLSGLSTSLTSLGVSVALSYVGSTITYDSDTAPLVDSSATWYYDLSEAASSVTLTITDENGDTVWTGTGEVAEGVHTLEWDGTDSDGNVVEDGNYTLSVSATDSSGSDVTVGIAASGKVTAVDSSDGDVTLEMTSMRVGVDLLQRVEAASS